MPLLALACFGVGQLCPAYAETIPLTDIVRKTMALYFAGSSSETPDLPGRNRSYQALARRAQPAKIAQKPAGVFVTLSRNGQSRACWGSAFPQYNTVQEATVYATLGALTKEYRYRPISRAEWKSLKPQVTVVKALEPISGLRGQNPLTDGLMLRQGSRSAVILPGEAKDATYQLVLCKLKAGVRPGEKFQLYRMIADVYR